MNPGIQTNDDVPLFRSVTQRKGPAEDDETTFEFLERGGRGQAIPIRDWMEHWFQVFPADARSRLKPRLQSSRFAEFLSAYFELQVFALLQRLGCSVDIEPSFPGTRGATVDFRARHGQDEFYMEATVCGLGQGVLSSNANEEDAIRKIREGLTELPSDLWLRAEGELHRTLGKRRLVPPFRKLLQKHTPDEVRALHSKHGRFEAKRYLSERIKEGDWTLTGSLVPPLASKDEGQVWGPVRTGAVSAQAPLTLALAKKAQDWRRTDIKGRSFLITVNVCNTDFAWNLDEIRALHAADGLEGTAVEGRTFAPYLSGVAGVLVLENATLGMERAARVQLHANPQRQLPECLQPLLAEQGLGGLLGFAPDA